MGLDDLKPAEGSRKARKRLGRGPASGQGGTAGKGHKGQNARSGHSVKLGFEGGQMPLQRKIPKRGFHNLFQKQFAVVNVHALNAFDDGAEVTPDSLVEAGLIKGVADGVKVLATGELSKRLTVRAHHFSPAAVAKIEAAGGSATTL